ncbi:MAG: hypothetical protein JKX72_00525 [Robiginitomaculum sp.]|nr:hypothetical protein [Robiginitomaculum sp.]
MRILFCGVAAIALSGCSWMGFGSGQNSHSYGNNSHGNYSYGCCGEGQKLSRWNFEETAGADYIVGGTAITGSQTSTTSPAPLMALTDVDMKDAYKTGFSVGLGGSYALNPNRKIVMEGTYSNAKGKDITWGTQGGGNLSGHMSDYNAYGINVGLRQYSRPVSVPLLRSVRPYVEARAGVQRVGAISLDKISQGVATSPNTPTSLNMYDRGWVPTGSAIIGFETPVFNRFTLGVESGIRYSGKLKSDNSDVAAGFNTRYAGFNNGGERYTVPVTIRGRYRF